jgi:hypothetical protein
MHESQFEKTLSDICRFLSTECSTAKWFAQAYVSWYRGKSEVNLEGVESLDRSNLSLFFKMLQLRKMPDWRDSRLYETERYAIDLFDL